MNLSQQLLQEAALAKGSIEDRAQWVIDLMKAEAQTGATKMTIANEEVSHDIVAYLRKQGVKVDSSFTRNEHMLFLDWSQDWNKTDKPN